MVITPARLLRASTYYSNIPQERNLGNTKRIVCDKYTDRVNKISTQEKLGNPQRLVYVKYTELQKCLLHCQCQTFESSTVCGESVVTKILYKENRQQI